MSLLVAYWQKDKLEVYSYIQDKPLKQASGPLDQLKPFRSAWGQKVLIVGRENLFQIRKRYPPAPIDKLAKAITLEVKELFPLSNPAFYFRIYKSYSTYTLIDLWGWEKGEVERLREVFPYTHLIPEDLVFVPDSPEINIYSYGGMIHILAHSSNRFLSGTSYPDKGLEEGEVGLFFHGLGTEGPPIKKIKIYGSLLKGLKGEGLPEIWRGPDMDYPLCLDNLPGLNLKEFIVKQGLRVPFKMDLLARFCIILLLGYGLLLYLTTRNYDRTLEEIGKKIEFLDKKKIRVPTDTQGEDYSEIVREVNKRLKASPSLLNVMDLLAQTLPKGTLINRMVLIENNLELVIFSKEPLAVIRKLGNTDGIKAVKLKGPPNKGGTSEVYSFALTVELDKK